MGDNNREMSLTDLLLLAAFTVTLTNVLFSSNVQKIFDIGLLENFNYKNTTKKNSVKIIHLGWQRQQNLSSINLVQKI